jgi:hypothetical protein
MLTFEAIDQLTVTEIILVADVVQKHYGDTPLKFNVITLKVLSSKDTFHSTHAHQFSRIPSSPSTSPGVMPMALVRTVEPSSSSF